MKFNDDSPGPYSIMSEMSSVAPKSTFVTPDAAAHEARDLSSRWKHWDFWVVDRNGRKRGKATSGRFHWLDSSGKEIVA